MVIDNRFPRPGEDSFFPDPGIEWRFTTGVLAPPEIISLAISPASGAVGSVFSISAAVSGNPTPFRSIRWRLNGEYVPDERNETFTATAAGTLTVELTVESTQGGPFTQTSAGVTISPNVINTVAPAITGTGKIGSLLTCTSEWTGSPAPEITFQWRRNGTDIPGAISAVYTPTAADDLTSVDCLVTGWNGIGAPVSVAAPGRPITWTAPVAAGALSDLSVTVGDVVTVDAAADFTGGGLTFAIQTGTAFATVNAAGLVTLSTAAVRSGATVTVRASNSGGIAFSTFLFTVQAAAVSVPVNTVLPSLSGTGRPGDIVTLDVGSWTGSPTFTRVWRIDGQPTGDTGVDFTPDIERRFTDLTCVVTGANVAGSASAETAVLRITLPAPVAAGTVPDQTVEVGVDDIGIDMTAYFIIEDDELFLSASWAATGAGATISTTGFLSVERDAARPASGYSVTCSNETGSAAQTFDITVTAAPVEAPSISGVAIDGQQLGYTVSLADCDIWWLQDDVATHLPEEVEDLGASFAAPSGQTTENITIGTGGYFHATAKRAGLYSNVASAAIDPQPVAAASVLTAHSVTPGATSASATITTDTGNGSIWYVTTQSATPPSDATIKAGTRVFVTAAGAVSLPITGLTVGETYWQHALQENAQGTPSTVSTATFTTAASGIAFNGATTPLNSSDFASSYSQAAAITDPVGGVLALVAGMTSAAADLPALTITLGGVAMTQLQAPEGVASQRVWSAIAWLASPGAGALTLEVSMETVGADPIPVDHRAFAVTLLDISGIVSWGAVDTIKPDLNTSLTPPRSFTSRALSGGVAIQTVTFDTGLMATPTAIDSTLLTVGNTGPLGTGDLTWLTSWTDVDGTMGFGFDQTRKLIAHRIVGLPA